MFNFATYYKFEHLADSKSVARFDCVAKSGSRNLAFEHLTITPTNGACYIYVNTGHRNIRIGAQGEAVLTIDKNKNHISKVYTSRYNGKGLIGYGDIKGTLDAMIIAVSEDFKTVEIFIAPFLKNVQVLIYEAYINNNPVMVDSANELRRQATKLI